MLGTLVTLAILRCAQKIHAHFYISRCTHSLTSFDLSCGSADPSIPHIHQGSLEPFKAGKPPAPTSSEEAALRAGKTVTVKNMDGDQGGRATAVFEVAAPPEIVWDCINDIKAYPKMVTGVVAVSIYDGPRTSGGVTTKKAQWTLGFMGYKQTYYNVLTFEPRQNSMTFKLDYTRNSDFDDAVGKWYVEPIGDGSSSRVFYSAALQLRIWLPKFVVNALFESTLGQATSWVAPEAMKRLAAAGGAPGGGGASAAAASAKCKRTWRGKKCPPPPPPPPPPAGPSLLRKAMDRAMLVVATAFVIAALSKTMVA